MPSVSVNGVRLAYQKLGEGPDVILVHGLATNRAFWFMRVARQLRQRFTVTTYDLRGHGASDMPPSGYGVADMSDDLAGLMDALGIERAALVGHSYGGVVALRVAALRPERVTRLVVADSRLNSLQPLQRLGDSPHLSEFERDFIKATDTDWNGESHVGLRFLEEVASPRYQELRVRRQTEFVPFSGFNGSRRTADRWLKLLGDTSAAEDFRAPVDLDEPTLRSVQAQTMLVYGERSRCLPSMAGLKAALPSALAVTVPRSGHFHPASRPGFFVRTVRRFLVDGTVRQPQPPPRPPPEPIHTGRPRAGLRLRRRLYPQPRNRSRT
jgi:pimeloyl-ACP methyl ester carboxylesterase